MTLWCCGGYTRLKSNKYKDWQVLADPESRDVTLLEREKMIYENWVSEQPPLVGRREYPTPKHILARETEDLDSLEQPWMDPAEVNEPTTDAHGLRTPSNAGGNNYVRGGEDGAEPTEDWEGKLDTVYVSVMHEITEEVRTGRYDEAVEHFPDEM
ncbi:hypothetical protein PHMEG_00010801 [Phytophthora megakarya]|uniref:Uncharacterized protein n=1 Tax=Phytophthora megakarya TaxID=4795 RepID=A0A225WEI6_9STRA|nr:hypothetical protein PHMEG_00010801 [Phytophthora megakarya]